MTAIASTLLGLWAAVCAQSMVCVLTVLVPVQSLPFHVCPSAQRIHYRPVTTSSTMPPLPPRIR